METQSKPVPANRIPESSLWFGMCAGAAAWAVQGFACFLIAARACGNGIGSLGPLPPAGVRILIGVITLVLLLTAIAGAVTSYRNWRMLSQRPELMRAEGFGRENFMSLIGIFVGVVFTIAIIWAGISPILENVCVTAR